jgi:molybdopterin-guanine dinucleotide biosynthesis protein A
MRTGGGVGAGVGVGVAIIAGGRATRMGAPGTVVKGLLVVDGRRIIDRQLDVLRGRFDELIIVANDPAPWRELGVRVVPDRHGGGGGGIGPLAGVDAALAAMPDGVDSMVCLAGDMPFINAGVVGLLRVAAPGAVAFVPRVAGRPEPLLARYGRAAQAAVGRQIEAGDYAMMHLLGRLDVTWLEEDELRAVDPQLRCLINVNTPDDLASGGGAPGRRTGG